MDRDKFYASARLIVFGGHLSIPQFQGIEAVLDACETANVTDSRHIGYILATPMIETGGSFLPSVESLNYTVAALLSKFPSRITSAQANLYGRIDKNGKTIRAANQQAIANTIYGGTFGKNNLGNIQPNDGYAFRGRGLVQLTGRRLYGIAGPLIGADLISNPDAACDLQDAAKIMAVGMRDGIFTNKKLSDYFNSSTSDWVNARRIINGTDRASDIAAYARKFNVAVLQAA
jgi:putative chitinase